MGKSWIYALWTEFDVFREISLSADQTVEKMRALVAKLVDETKDNEILGVTRRIEE